VTRKPHPSDISEEEWHFVAPYLTLMDVNAPQRRYDLREVFNALRWLARAGAPWRLLSHDLPPWQMVYQQLRKRGACGHDSYKRRRGSKVHMAVDTLGQLIAMTVTPADEQERIQVKALCEAVQEATGETVRLAWAGQGYMGKQAKQDAQSSGIDLQIVKLPEARKGSVLLPRRWVVERSFGWLSRFGRLSRDFERLPQVLASLHFMVFAIRMLPKATAVLASGGSSQHALERVINQCPQDLKVKL
jgi:transposase